MSFGLDKHDVSAIKRTALRNLLTKQHSMGDEFYRAATILVNIAKSLNLNNYWHAEILSKGPKSTILRV